MSFAPFKKEEDRNPPFFSGGSGRSGFGGRDAAFERIVKEGNYYFPAWKHYRQGVNVVCDRCARVQLPASIGYSDQDLCLNCAEKISNQMNNRTNPFGGVTKLDQIGGSGKVPLRKEEMMPSSHFPKVEDDDDYDDDMCTFMEFGSHYPERERPPRLMTRMAVSSAFPRSRGNMEVSQARPSIGLTTNMEVSQARPSIGLTTNMEVSQARPSGGLTTYMEVSQARPSRGLMTKMESRISTPSQRVVVEEDPIVRLRREKHGFLMEKSS